MKWKEDLKVLNRLLLREDGKSEKNEKDIKKY